MQITADEIGAILSTHFGGQGWDISRPRDGWQKESFWHSAGTGASLSSST